MARSTTAARRYAEAAFEIALRDSTVDAWRSELDQAAEVIADPAVAEGVHNRRWRPPAVRPRSRRALARR
jgi:F0F1-type ATP synthase delta subunit